MPGAFSDSTTPPSTNDDKTKAATAPNPAVTKASLSTPPMRSTTSSVTDLGYPTADISEDGGVLLDAEREVRAKLYMGRVFLGWFWFIPTFHMPHPIPSSGPAAATGEPSSQTTHFKLTRKEIDFAVGVGTHIVDVDVELQWVTPNEPAAVLEPPQLTTSPSPEASTPLDVVDGEGSGVTGNTAIVALQALVGGSDVKEAVEAAKATNE